jgi:hypothetical protein
MTDKSSSAMGAVNDVVIKAYAAYVDPLKLSPSEIRDEDELPYSKKRIIDALTAACSLSGEAPSVSYAPSKIRGWLLLLAQFQSGVGEPIRDPAAEVARRMSTEGEQGGRTEAGKLSQQVAEESAHAGWSVRRTKFEGKVNQERTRLLGLL